MITKKIYTILGLALVLTVWPGKPTNAAPMGTAFTYQGRLMDANSTADGLYDFEFRLFADPILNSFQVGDVVEVNDLDVIDGYFTVLLDFGDKAFTGNARWLEIGVRPGESEERCTILRPRQEVTPTPYAIYAENTENDNDWKVSDSNMYSVPTGYIGIGTPTPISKLEVMATESVHGIRSTVPYIAVYGHRTGTAGTWPGVHGECDSLSSNTAGVRGVINSTSPGTNSAGVRGINNGTGATGAGVYGWQAGSGYGIYGSTPSGIGVYGRSTDTGDTQNYGGYFEADGERGRAVYGEASTGDGVVNYGGYFVAKGGRGKGVYGEASDTGDFQNEGGRFAACGRYGRGVYGNATGSDGRGVYGLASASSGTNFGVYGETYSSTGYAGYFKGRVRVTGYLYKDGGGFQIDHPLEPANKYLYHSFVESPDMMNVYNGNVILDENGEACVQLPKYFEALNRDFRYQLTAIGAPAPNLYIAGEISENRFKIAGGKAGMKVSWQVSGIRQDRYAQAHPIVVEEDKAVEAHGYYLHPELYGYGEEKSIEAVHNSQFSETRQVAINTE